MSRRPFLLSPSHWPVKVRLAVVSAALTFAILLVFAAVVGRLAEDRLRDDFRNDLQANATDLALAVNYDCVTDRCTVLEPDLDTITPGSGAEARIVGFDGTVLEPTIGGAELGPPVPGLSHSGSYEVYTRQVTTNAISTPIYAQYGRTHAELDKTIGRLWLFLGIGVLGGALLAALAGMAVAGRAMRPIRALTATAREIAATRDPSRRVPQPDTDDEISELAATLNDMLAELDAARGETQLMVTAQRDFVADASHELRTPLTSILANLELLEERLEHTGRGGEEEGEMVGSALRSSHRMRRLVADLLLLARADAGRVGERRLCDLAEIADAAVLEVRPTATDHEIEVDVDGPLPVDGNPDELHRLVLNLVDNAVSHTPAHTRVTVSAGRRRDEVFLEVCDDGPGLPAAPEHLFTRFVRGAGPADSTAHEGTGLGLAIVRAVAESHGGTVDAGAASHGGARFVVTFPAAPADAESGVGKLSANL